MASEPPAVITTTTLTDFEDEASSGSPPSEEADTQTIPDRLLDPVSPTLGLRVIPGEGDPVYLQNRGKERCLFRDDHGRWFILTPSVDDATDEWVKWVYLPPGRPEQLVQAGRKRRTYIGFDYVRRSEVPDPVSITVAGKYVGKPLPDSTYECGSCNIVFEEAIDHARHCWTDHPTVALPEQLRLRHDPGH